MILEKDLENAILSFHHKLMDEMYKQAKQLRLTSSQLEVLHCVGEKGNPTMKEIANSLHITPPSVTSIVESLCEKNFLKRETYKKDRRIVRIIITPKALKLFSSFKNKKLTILKNLFLKLNNKDKKELINIINIIIKD
jgi:DNA-binding MarR family transcriptional regulator